MTELRLNVDSKDIIEAGDYKSTQRGMLTFSKNAVYLGDGDKANKIIDAESLKTVESKKLVEYINIATNNEKFEELKKQTSLEYIFKNWTKVGYTWNNNTKKIEVNNSTAITEMNSWYFDSATNSIVNPVNSNAFIYLLSPIAKDNYSVTLDLTTTFGDNDVIMLCVGEVTVNGVPYNLSFLRNKNASGAAWILKMNVLRWYVDDDVLYSYTLDSSKNNLVLGFSNQSSGYKEDPIELKFERNSNTIKAWTGGGGTKTPREDTLISYTLPSSKPSNMSNDMWAALNLILGKPCVYGLGCQSQPMHFKIKEQNNFSINDIYNAVDKKLYTWNGSNWVGTPKELDIPNNTLISNQSTKETFYYFNNAFNELVKNPLDIIDNKVAKLLTSNMAITLGGTEGFSNDRYGLINAINEAGKYRSVNNAKITIKLPTDITLSDSMLFQSIDLSHVIIEGRSTADRTVLKFADGVAGKIIFNFDYSSGPTFRYLSLQDNAKHSNTGIVLNNNSMASIENITINGFKNGIELRNSRLTTNGASKTTTISNCTVNGAYIVISSIFEFEDGIFDGNNIACGCGASTANLTRAEIKNSTTGIQVGSAGIVQATGSVLTNNTKDCNIAYNTVTSNGIVFK
ncbi:TPA: hypothetical protein SB288_001557 [Campylobacter coli]|nr:hypothetical protein [Campylobacter coli]